MTLNLNREEDLTLERVAQFISSSDDSISRQVRVTKGGIAFISDDTSSETVAGLAFRLESFDRGNGYLGEDASKDMVWVAELRAILRRNWPNPVSTYIG